MIRLLILAVLLLGPTVAPAWATVTTTTSRNAYTGTGAQTVFPYTFRTLANTDLRVSVNGTIKTLTTDYTVSGVGASGGGNVTFVAAPASGTNVVIERNVPVTQLTDYVENAPFSAEGLERNLDKLTMIAQQLTTRVVQAPAGSPSLTVPAPGGDQCLAWNTGGTALVAVTCGPTTVTGTPPNDIQGTSQFLFTSKPGLLWEAALGTAAAPSATAGVVFKLSRTMGITADPPAGCTGAGIDNECGSAMEVTNVGVATNKMMVIGLTTNAISDHTPGLTGGSGDVGGLYSVGRKTGGAGTVYGAYMEARRDSIGTGIGIGLRGAEISHRNITATNCTADAGGGNCASVWVTGTGNAKLGVGVAIRDSGAGGVPGKFQTGFQCTDYSAEGTGSSCYRDDSLATTSILIAGTHTTGLDFTSSTISGASVLMANNGAAGWGTGANPVTLRGSGASGLLTLGWGAGDPTLKLLGSAGAAKTLAVNGNTFRVLAQDGTTVIFQLTDAGAPSFKAGAIPTGAATGKKVVCVHTDGTLHASSTGTDCTN